MKKSLTWGVMALIIASLSSCVSSKKIIYFQGSEEMFNEPQEIMQKYEMRLKPADQIMVKVTSKEPELLEMFTHDVMMGQGSGNSSYMSSSARNTMGTTFGYTVDNEGLVHLPLLGEVKVGDLTCDEASKIIEKRILEKKIVSDPDVTVRLLNARVTVVGAVKGAQVVDLSSERNSIIDVLARCGDLSDQSLRQRVKLYREEDGKRSLYNIDLTQADIFNNPAFYVQQNDLIYVESNKSQNVRSSAFTTFLSAGSSIIGFASSVLALIIALSK